MKTILTIFLLTLFSNVHSQEGIDSTTIATQEDYQLEKLRSLSKKIFVIATMDEEKVHSVKFDSKNSFGIRFWIKSSYKYKKVKNKKGVWVEYKNENYTMTLVSIDCLYRKYEILKVLNYDGKDNIINSIDGNGLTEYIVPDSNMETFSSIICN